MICFEISRSRSNLVTVLTLKFHVTNHALTINLDQSDEAAHWCLNTQTQEKVCVWCVFEPHTQGLKDISSTCVNSWALRFESAKALLCAAATFRDNAVDCGKDHEHHF
jgi:hypothetical protein